MEPALPDLRARKREALEAVVRENAGPLLRGAMALGLGEGEAEDLVQEAFTAFLAAVERFEGRSSVRTFLFGILYNKARERGRLRAREVATDPVDAVFESRFDARGHWTRPPRGPDDEALSAETDRLLAECLKGLPEAQRAAFQLKEVEGLEPAQACNALAVTATHLRVLLFRARHRLRECLEGKWDARGARV
ncbi:MAG: sigma-70 family RNA polymerase sigma factor [Elusimicrobia bacterium]|nr:sigma-70 family RNA polymerase sigma factor [Elusimicrobiota bacterium]